LIKKYIVIDGAILEYVMRVTNQIWKYK